MSLKKKVTGIILAAGEGSRMGETKQLLTLGNQKISQWAINAAERSDLDRVIIVVGHHHRAILSRLRFHRATVVVNPLYKNGLSASMKAGLNAIEEDSAAMFLLADQPEVTTDHINLLLSIHQKSKDTIIVPTYKGRRGNPVIFNKHWFEELKAVAGDKGGRRIIQDYPDQVTMIELDAPEINYDIDTREQLDEADRRFQKTSIPSLPASIRISELLPTEDLPHIALVGGGGKTSLLFQIASELRDQNRRTFVSTSTAMFHPDRDGYSYQNMYVGPLESAELPHSTAGITVAARTYDPAKNKIYGYSTEELDAIYQNGRFDTFLIEADGAKHRPIKAPAEYEPVIPSTCNIVIGVIGLDCIGKPVSSEWVHRVDLFAQVAGAKFGEPITPDCIRQLVISENGLFKNTPDSAKKILILNKADEETDVLNALEIIERLVGDNVPEKVLVSSIQKERSLFEYWRGK